MKNTLLTMVVVPLLIAPAAALDRSPVATEFQNGGVAVVPGELPTTWSPKSMAWTADPAGYGQATPVVFGDTVVITSTEGPNKETYFVTAYALSDGKPRWRVQAENPTPKTNNRYTTRAAPTPVVDDSSVYVFLEGGLVMAIDADGEKRWEMSLTDKFGDVEARFGLSSSLEQDNEKIYLWAERENDPYVLAMNKSDGSVAWKVDGVGSTAWGSPRLISIGGEDHLVLSAAGKVQGLHPSDGRVLWTFEDVEGNTSQTPMPAGKNRFLMGASVGRGERTESAAAASNGLIEVTPDGDGGFEPKWVWRADKATSSFNSPAIDGDSVLFVNRAGVLYRLSLQTGETMETRRIESGSVWATPVVTDRHVFLFGTRGTAAVIDRSTGETIAENRCWPEGEDGTLYAGTPVIDRDEPMWILRRGDRIYAVR